MIRICVSAQQIYPIVLQIQTSVASAPNTRWTFLQDPVSIEEALGRKFRDGLGAAQVAAGDYDIIDARNRAYVLSIDSWLKLGCSIIMAVIVN